MASATAAHRFYALLPPHVAPESVETERLALLERVQQTLEVLRTSGGELQAHHFRAITTYVELKHELPARLHAELVDALVETLWKEQSAAPLGDVNLQNRALKVLATLMREWKHRVESDKSGIALSVDWQVVRAAVERACFSTPGSFRRASQPWLAQIADCTVKAAEQVRSLLRPSSGLLVEQLWAEFGPTIQDTSRMECFQALATFSLLLSFTEDTADVQSSVEKLLPEWLAAWAQISRCAEWDGHWIKILSRVAKRLPSSHLWDAHIAFIFAKIHDSLALPSDFGAPPKNNAWPSAASTLNGSKNFENYTAKFCVYLMQNPVAEEQPARANQLACELLHTVKGFFHPSNVSKAAGPVVSMLHSLSEELAYRLGREKAGENDGNQLALSSCRGVLDELLQIMLLGIYSKNRAVSMKCALVIKNILCIDPVEYTTTVLDEMVRALDPMAMSQSHLASTSITSMATFLFHLMCGRNEKSTGAFFTTYLLPILRLTLPGIDANDERKTISTVMLYFQILGWLPLVNDSSKSSGQSTKSRGQLSTTLFDDMTTTAFVSVDAPNAENDQRLWELGSSLEEWALTLLSRCFQFFSSRASAAEQSSSNRGGRGQTGRKGDDADEDQVAMQVANMLSLLYSQLSPPLFIQALRQTTSFLSNMFSSASSNGKLVEQLLYSCLQGNPSVAFKQIIPIVFDKLRVTKTSIDVSTLTTSEKIWNLYLLNGLVRFNDPDDRFLLRYRNELTVILRHFLTKEDDKDVYEVASRVLQHLLNALLGVYTHDFRSLPREQWQDAVSNDSGAFQYLGVSVSWKRLDISWHEPNAEEFAFGLELLQDHLVTPLNELKELEDAKDITVKSWSNRLNRVLHSIRGAGSILVDGVSSPIENALLSGAMPLLKNALVGDEKTFDAYVELKPMVMARVHELVVFWRENGAGTTQEIPLWTSLLGAISQLLIWRGGHQSKYRLKEKENDLFKDTTTDVASRAFQKVRSIDLKTPRMDQILLASRNELIERSVFFYAKRNYVAQFELADFFVEGGSSTSSTRVLYETLLLDVEQLLKNAYSDVRSLALEVRSECSELYSRWTLSRVPAILTALSSLEGEDTVKEETVLGLLNAISDRNVLQQLWRRERALLYRLFAIFFQSNEMIVKRVNGTSSKSKIGKKIQNFFLLLVAQWTYAPIMGDSAITELLAAEPPVKSHWRFHAMFLSALYPFVQPGELPIPIAVWQITMRHLSSNVMPVRQIALIMFSRLVKVYKAAASDPSLHKDWTHECKAIVYTRDTIEVLLDIMLKDRRSSAGSNHRSAASEWLAGVRELAFFLAGDRNAYPHTAPLSTVNVLNQPRSVMTTLNFARVKLVQKLVQSNPTAFFTADVVEVLHALATNKLVSSTSEEERHAALTTLAEWISGILRALIKSEPTDREIVDGYIQSVVEVLKKILLQLSVSDVRQWVEVMHFISRPGDSGHADIARLGGLVHSLLDELENSFARATQEDYARQAKWLHLIETLAIHFLPAGVIDANGCKNVRPLAEEIAARTLIVIRTHALAHQYEAIRHRAGKMLFVLDMYSRPSSSAISKGSGPLSAGATDEVLEELLTTAALFTPDGVETYVKTKEKKEAVHAKETAIHWLDWTVACGEQRDFMYMATRLFPVALLSEKHAKPEVAEQARGVMDTTASWLRLYAVPSCADVPVAVNVGDVDALLEVLETHAGSSAWKTRAAALRFITTVAFFHWMFWSSTLKQRVHALVRRFLADEQREVQAMAKFAMRSLIHHEHPAAVAALSDKLAKDAEKARTSFNKLKRRYEQLESSMAEEGELETARKRMKKNEDEMARSVLGMSAAVLAFPHDLPQFVPPMVEALGKFLYVRNASSAVSFLGKEARETLLEFKRTHQDTWAETKARLTPAQRAAVEDVSLAPSYFS